MSVVNNIWLLYDTPFATGNDWEIFAEAPSGGSLELSFNNGSSWVSTTNYTTLGTKSGFKYTPSCFGALSCTPPVANGGTILAKKAGESTYLTSTIGMVEQVTGGEGFSYAYTAYCNGTSISLNIAAQYASNANNYQLNQTDTQKIRLNINSSPVTILTQWVDSGAIASTYHWMQVFDTITYSTASFPLSASFSDITSVVSAWNSTISVGTISDPCTNAQNTTATAVNDSATTGTIGTAQNVNVSTNDTPCNLGVTTYIIQGSPTGATVSLNPSTGVASVTPTASTWNFQYAIYCNGIKISANATVSGTAGAACTNVTVNTNTLATSVETGNAVGGSITLNGSSAFTIGSVTGLPAGTSVSLSGSTITLTGNTTTSGTYNYSIPVTNCSVGSVTITGTIVVSSTPVCTTPSVITVNPSVATVGVAYSGTVTINNATSATLSGLGSGLSAGTPVVSGANITIPITGTPSGSATLNLTINATNACGGGSTTSSITGVSAGTIVISSVPTCPVPAIVNNVSPITTIQGNAYSGTIVTSNATSATITNLPAGLTQSFSSNVITISGTPIISGVFNLLVNLTNACGGGSTTTNISGAAAGTLTVNSPTSATANDDAYDVPVNTFILFDLKTNDVLCSNSAVTTFQIVAQPTHGDITQFSTNASTGVYTPDADYVGADSFTYRILCNGVEKSVATVTLNVVVEGATGTITGKTSPTCNTDEIYTFNQTAGTTASGYNWSVVGGEITHGQGSNSVVIKWNSNTFGTKIITLIVNNPNPYTFNYSVQLVCANAEDDVFISKDGNPISVDVKTNDTECNSGVTKYLIIDTPINGSITFQNPFIGVFTYQPNKNFYGKDVFTYGVYCNNVLVDSARVTITSSSTDVCYNRTCNPCWVKTTTWKCISNKKLYLYHNTNQCYRGDSEKWVEEGDCKSCTTCN